MAFLYGYQWNGDLFQSDWMDVLRPESAQWSTAAGTGTTSMNAAGASASSVLGNISIGLTIGQTIGSVYSAFVSSSTNKAVAKSRAKIAENNRQMAQMSVESAYLQRDSRIAQLTYRAGQTKAKQRTAYGASGVATNTGSASEVLASTDIMKEIDKKTERMNALSSAWGYRSQMYQASAQSKQSSIMANYYGSSAWGNAAGSLVSGASAVADRWYKYYGS